MKKMLVMAACLALIITLSVTGTLAFDVKGWFHSTNETDSSQISTYTETGKEASDTESNVYSTPKPNADISQKIDKGSNYLLPSPNSASMTALSGSTLWNSGGVKHYVTVENKGNVDVYVRTVIAIENPATFNFDLVKINYNNDSTVGKWKMIGDAELSDGIFRIYTFTYNEALKCKTDENTGNPTTAPSLKEIGLDLSATNEDVAVLDGGLDIKAVSQAVQVDGETTWNSAETALNDAFNKITTTQNPWKTTTTTNAKILTAVAN